MALWLTDILQNLYLFVEIQIGPPHTLTEKNRRAFLLGHYPLYSAGLYT
jgi:hypothetical protein